MRGRDAARKLTLKVNILQVFTIDFSRDPVYRVDFLTSNVQSSHQEALWYVFEDNEAVIKIILKGRSLTMRHVLKQTKTGYALSIPDYVIKKGPSHGARHGKTEEKERVPTGLKCVAEKL